MIYLWCQEKGETMARQINDWCLDIISDIQRYIIEYTEYLNEEDTIDVDTFIAHWLLAEVTSIRTKGETE